jgi:hypothetical protein
VFVAADRNIVQDIVIKADKLAEELANRRHYISVDAAKGVMHFDPRFLVFEFTYNMLLRESQVGEVLPEYSEFGPLGMCILTDTTGIWSLA